MPRKGRSNLDVVRACTVSRRREASKTAESAYNLFTLPPRQTDPNRKSLPPLPPALDSATEWESTIHVLNRAREGDGSAERAVARSSIDPVLLLRPLRSWVRRHDRRRSRELLLRASHSSVVV